MLKKRFVGVIIVRDGWAVQSFGFRRYLPIGNPTVVAENLDRWGADEILVLAMDRSSKGLGPDFELLDKLAKLSLSTPLTYGGGICNAEYASLVIQSCAERICLDTALHGDIGLVREISINVGAQALVGSLPLSMEAGELKWYRHVTRTQNLGNDTIQQIFAEGLISEALVIDWKHEGIPNSFDLNLLCNFPSPDVPLIAFGGLSEVAQFKEVLTMPKVVAVSVGNFLNYKEHAVQHYKQQIESPMLRQCEYFGQFS